VTAATTSLKDMCELVVDCPHFTPDWTASGYIVIRNQNIRNGRLDLSDASYTHRQDFDRRNRRAKPRSGDIIFTREAPMGEVCIVPAGLECCIGQRQVLLRPKREVDGKYLFYALRSNFVRHQIFWNEGTGSTVSNVRIPVLEALKIPRLGSSEKSIGDLLGALDDKIDLNAA
jgi:type I restriction enzyme S subunit